MGSILSPAYAALERAAAQQNGVHGYKPQHTRDGGECALTLDTLPVLVRYELTYDGSDEIAEVTQVCICGHVIEAGDFAADIRAEWGRQCMQLREGL